MDIFNMQEKIDCILSLTSWKGRINHPDVCKALYCCVRQKTNYNYKTVLVLSKEEFPNMNADLPETIKLFESNNLIEILWTDDNLKALKKLHPTMKKYNNIPILTTDDDIYLSDNIVETFMNMHNKYPTYILSECGHPFMLPGEICTGMFRLFPPNSILDIDTNFFKLCYNTAEDDAYLAILAKLKGTVTKILRTGLAFEFNGSIQNTAFKNVYLKINPSDCQEKLLKALKSNGII